MKSEVKDWLDGRISIHNILVVDDKKGCVLHVLLIIAGRTTPFYLNVPHRLFHSDQQIAFDYEVHRVVFSFLLVDDVLDPYFGILLLNEQTVVGIVDLSFLDDVVVLYSIFGSVMLDIYPEFVLISQHLEDADLNFAVFEGLLDIGINSRCALTF